MLQRVLKVRQGTVWIRSGHIYQFRYKNFQNDPEPVVIALYAIKGVHPNSGHKWNLYQCINFTYIPRSYRKQFVSVWKPLLERNKGNSILTWDMVVKRYPYLQIAIRRYILDEQLITQLKEIPLEDIDQVVVSTWAKDYSKQVLMSMISKFKKVKSVVRRASPFSGKSMFGRKGLFGGKR
jgi:hypothetical protein